MKKDPEHSIVKIYTLINKPYYVNSWVSVPTKRGSGTGFVIDGNRILTNAHVVADKSQIYVRNSYSSRKYKAEVLRISQKYDLALLSVKDSVFFKGIEPIRVRDEFHTNIKVKVYGFPGSKDIVVTEGILSAIDNHYYKYGKSVSPAGEINAVIRPGNSGSPVFLDDKAIGIIMQAARRNNTGLMVPGSIINSFIYSALKKYDGP